MSDPSSEDSGRQPPEYTRRVRQCPYRVKNECFNALNYFHPWACTEFCVEKLDSWVCENESGLSEEEVQASARKLVQWKE